ncbi:alginate export protein [Chitinophaga niastensis]|uniref:Alginate export protein n=1 Tax=Chitinophaga niastensis TaxID=536980 RepID=A0A2P8HNT0_CHINA|nr:alginate export family protein [Chitinophaga niastensis]PSL47871.1 alginate export protein [Chitinophaga niastensis]
MKKWFLGGASFILSGSLLQQHCYAQLSLGAQLRTRTELRNGQGTPQPEGATPALFTSQRTRLTAGFSAYRIKLGLTVQDTRVWGQDASTINRTTTPDNNGFMLHEAWAEILLTDTIWKNKSLSLKVGRQELVYDDSRLLGNLDWLQQGRRHDAAVLKYESTAWMIHTGVAFNQNKENAAGTIYNPTPPGNYTANTNGGNAYKSLEFVYASRKLNKGNLSFLFFADQFSKYHTDSVDHLPVKTWEATTNNRMTTGLFYTQQFNRMAYTASAYYQFGTNANAQTVNGRLLSGAFQYSVSKAFSAGAGVDYTNADFDPLYGTPHKFWGNMDYFYVASGFGNKGLQDYYIKTKLKPGTRWALTGDVHEFYSDSEITGMSRKFGTEADVTATYALTKIIGFEAGYSHFWSTASLASPTVKNVKNASANSNWAYVMIIIRPEFLIK